MDGTLLFAAVREDELDLMLEGGSVDSLRPWNGGNLLRRFPEGTFGIFAYENGDAGTVHPVALVIHEADSTRLFARYGQLRTELSPLSSWCHILEAKGLEGLDCAYRLADLDNLEAAWAGLVIAEAQLLAGREFARLKLASCLATSTFSIARARAIWPRFSIDDVIERHDAAVRIVRQSEQSNRKIRDAFLPIWAVIVAISRKVRPSDWQLEFVIDALQALVDIRSKKSGNEFDSLFHSFKGADEAGFLRKVEHLSSEQRVNEFDTLINLLKDVDSRDKSRKQMLCFLAAFTASIAAGGSPSLGLVSAVSREWPEVVAWTYVIGGIGERVTWTSSFEGLGRLVVREMMRPLRLDEAPTCDFALEEGSVLVDRQLRDPLVHLKIKQSRIVNVGIFPGVNTMISLNEQMSYSDVVPAKVQRAAPDRDFVEVLVDALWPYIADRIGDRDRNVQRPARRIKRSKNATSQTKLRI